MKRFTRIEPTTTQTFGLKYQWTAVIKKFKTEDGIEHEFTTYNEEGARGGAVIALTPDNKVVTTFEFRAGPEYWMYELPGGELNQGEDPEAGALRELREETGYRPGKVEFLGTTYGDAYTNFRRHYYLATDCMPGDRQLDGEEEAQGAEVRLISIEELIDNAKCDKMTDSTAVLMAYEKLIELSNGENN